MSTLVITSGNSKYFNQLKNFVDSLRINGEYHDYIAICDNAILGKWNDPGTWEKAGSFTAEQLAYFNNAGVTVFTLQQLISENNIDEQVITNIKSPTQRYPYKFVYNTLISKKFLSKVDVILYFDSDVYVQSPIAAITERVEDGRVMIVKEWLKMKESIYLDKWLKYSDFSQLSAQKDFLDAMLPADNFCSGFYGGSTVSFHRFNLLALLITSNKFINFYSDQPLVNILKTYFFYPFQELDWTYCLHLGELKAGDYKIVNHKFVYEGKVPVAIHFNSGKYTELEQFLEGKPFVVQKPENSMARKIYRRVKRLFIF